VNAAKFIALENDAFNVNKNRLVHGVEGRWKKEVLVQKEVV
jgi:hypothetical protein